MYVEERMYQLQPGKVDEYFKQYGAYGMPVQLRHLPHMLGYYQTEIGPLNMVVHLWAYDDLDQRAACRARLFADPDWQAYRPRIKGLIVKMDTRVMRCAPFFVERLKKMLAA
jgi:hypothetical protein